MESIGRENVSSNYGHYAGHNDTFEVEQPIISKQLDRSMAGSMVPEERSEYEEDNLLNIHFDGKMSDVSSMVSRLAGEITSLRRQNKAVEAQNVKLNSLAEKRREEFEEVQMRMQNLNEKARAALTKMEERIRQKERDFETKERETLRETEARTHKVNMQYQREVSNRDRKLQELSSEVELTKHKLENSEAEVAQMKESFKTYQADVEGRLKKSLADRENDQSSRMSLKEKMMLKGKVSSLESELATLSVEVTEERARARALEVQTRKLLEQNKEHKTQTELEDEIVSLRKDKELYAGVVAQNKQQIDKLEEGIRDMLMREGALQERLRGIESKPDPNHAEKIKELIALCDSRTGETEELRAALANSQNENKKLKRMNKELLDEVHSTQALLEKLHDAEDSDNNS